jgi:hypothetical protein
MGATSGLSGISGLASGIAGATPYGAALGALGGIASSVAGAMTPPPNYSTKAANNYTLKTHIDETSPVLNLTVQTGGAQGSQSAAATPTASTGASEAGQTAAASGGQGNTGQSTSAGSGQSNMLIYVALAAGAVILFMVMRK